jgi:DNA-binding HxlR family transcriptional regulator
MKYCNACTNQSRHQNAECVINKTTNLVGKKWALAVLMELCSKKRKMRFNELQKLLFPITPKILTKRLKELEGEGIIARTETAARPLPAVDYTLTPKGKDLLNTLKELARWSQQWYGRDNVTCSMMKRLC